MDSQTLKQGRGRPSKYKDEYPDKLLEYFAEYLLKPSDRQVVEETTKYYPTGQVKESFAKYKTVSRGIPTLFGFARSIGVDYDTVLRWSKQRIGTAPEKGEPDRRPHKYPDFCGAYKKAIHFQTEFILGAGMSGAAPAPFVIFAAKNMIGWRDTMEQRFVDGKGKDVGARGYVLLPPRKTEDEAAADFEQQETEAQ